MRGQGEEGKVKGKVNTNGATLLHVATCNNGYYAIITVIIIIMYKVVIIISQLLTTLRILIQSVETMQIVQQTANY